MIEEENLDYELEHAEEELSYADESDETPPNDIVAFNELRSCADLYRLHDANQLEIQPDYQRDVVWQPSEQTRFIDSLAKQLPIPSMCVSLDYKTEKRQVVDGLQRMTSIIRFLSEDSWRLSNLPDIDKRISNKTVDYIKREHPEVYSRIENTTIPVTVLRCDLSKRSHQEYLFTIFHRLNKGGLKLTNQEIRNCIYSGPFNNMLRSLAASAEFVRLMSVDPQRKYRFSNEELILRILAFSKDHSKYKGPLSKYLNAYMSTHRRDSEEKIDQITAGFSTAISIVYEKALGEEPMPRLSKATVEAIFVGVYRHAAVLAQEPAKRVRERYLELRKDPLFSIDALKEGLAATERVKSRLDRAVEIFGAQ
ncbi:MAG: DUF262 domain-containing protein [Rhodobacter sp.]|nr:DUF262 domain-containing protein [Rhodobacter sp.]